MKKRYTKRQILESIKYWTNVLKSMNESAMTVDNGNGRYITLQQLWDICKDNKEKRILMQVNDSLFGDITTSLSDNDELVLTIDPAESTSNLTCSELCKILNRYDQYVSLDSNKNVCTCNSGWGRSSTSVRGSNTFAPNGHGGKVFKIEINDDDGSVIVFGD